MFENLQPKDKLVEGKTKVVMSTNDPDLDIIGSKDDITAGDGAKHDILPGKGIWSNTTTCNIFRLLNACGIPTAFQGQLGERTFVARKCQMIPLEVVVRREGHGSYLQRCPNLKKGHLFPRLVVELDLKTSGKKWNGHGLVCDDPIIVFTAETAQLFDTHKPLWEQKPFLEIPLEQFYAEIATNEELVLIEEYARRVFLVLEKVWQLLNQRLVDFKLEFAKTSKHVVTNIKIVLADVIDSDSWRKLKDGKYADKQVYRDGGPLAEVAEKFREAAELSARFELPRQQIVLWRGSPHDDMSAFENELMRLSHASVKVTAVTRSAHRESVKAYQELHEALQNIPDSVVVSAIGMSNGASPTLSASCVAPVIAVPATAGAFPDDVWSSLRAPTDVPVMTVLAPKNAVLAALQILALRNPALYANLRYEQEKRLPNIFVIDS